MGAFGLNVAKNDGRPPVIDLCGVIEALIGDHKDRRSGHELLIDLANSQGRGYISRYIRERLSDNQARIIFAHLRLHEEKIDEFVRAIPWSVTVTVTGYLPGNDLRVDNSEAMRMAKHIAKEWLNDFRDFQPRRVSEVIRLLQRLGERTASDKDERGKKGKAKGETMGEKTTIHCSTLCGNTSTDSPLCNTPSRPR